MYIRFVTYRIDEQSGHRQGLFHAAAKLRETGVLYQYERARLEDLRDWFNDNLERPDSFARSRGPHATYRALSWFKDTARDHIARMYEVATILEAHGIAVHVVKTARPGYVTYEDEDQVTAEPYAETGT